jgi:hypothetical protein
MLYSIEAVSVFPESALLRGQPAVDFWVKPQLAAFAVVSLFDVAHGLQFLLPNGLVHFRSLQKVAALLGVVGHSFLRLYFAEAARGELLGQSASFGAGLRIQFWQLLEGLHVVEVVEVARGGSGFF